MFGVAIQKGKSEAGLLKGVTHKHMRTKQLLQTISPGMVAVIYHHDIDELAAEGLIRARVKLIVNAGETMSGKVPILGPLMILEQGIPIVEIESFQFPSVPDDCEVSLSETSLIIGNQIIPCTPFTRDIWLQQYKTAQKAFSRQLLGFINNTLSFAQSEKELVLAPLACKGMCTRITGRDVLVVIRGKGYVKDLQALRFYIKHQKPVLVGVDGGADALIEQGYRPDLIVGDMDSVSDTALHCGAELIVHAYAGGYAPGLRRVQDMGLDALTMEACGTSEDMALLLAYDQDCERIVTVGAHSDIHDFLEKGRQGMGSTVLVRIKVGSKLIDSKGFHLLLKSGASGWFTRVCRRLNSWLKP